MSLNPRPRGQERKLLFKNIMTNSELHTVAKAFGEAQVPIRNVEIFVVALREDNPLFDEDRFLRAYRHYAGIQRGPKKFRY